MKLSVFTILLLTLVSLKSLAMSNNDYEICNNTYGCVPFTYCEPNDAKCKKHALEQLEAYTNERINKTQGNLNNLSNCLKGDHSNTNNCMANAVIQNN